MENSSIVLDDNCMIVRDERGEYKVLLEMVPKNLNIGLNLSEIIM